MDKGGEGEKSRIVVDASVVVKWVIAGEPGDAQAKSLKNSIASGEVEAYAPPLLLYEVASAFFKSIQKGILNPGDGREALRAMGELGINIQTISWNDLTEILSIATATNLTIYDSTYLYLSNRLEGKLVTADEILEEKGKTAAEIILLRDLKLPLQ